MIVVMKPGATAADIGAVIRKAETFGVQTHPIYGENRTVVALVGDLTGLTREVFDQMEGVSHTLRIQEPYKLASRTARPENSVIDVAGGRVRVGGSAVVVMAGPCSVEDRQQIIDIAYAVRETLTGAAGQVARAGRRLGAGACKGGEAAGAASTPACGCAQQQLQAGTWEWLVEKSGSR